MLATIGPVGPDGLGDLSGSDGLGDPDGHVGPGGPSGLGSPSDLGSPGGLGGPDCPDSPGGTVALVALVVLVAHVALVASPDSDLLAILFYYSCSSSNPSNSIIQQFYGLAIASTELCELVLETPCT